MLFTSLIELTTSGKSASAWFNYLRRTSTFPS